MMKTFDIRRGVNISHWLSQSDRRGRPRRDWFGRDDMLRLRDAGLDHVRLPVDEEQLYTAGHDREGEAFDLLDAALDWAAEAGLRAIVDLHILRSHHFLNDVPLLFTDARQAERLAAVWADLSSVLSGRKVEDVAYELMNEPVAPDPEDWNRVSKLPLAAIRQREPERAVLLGSNTSNSVFTFDALDVPRDNQLVLSFHYYLPMALTHYRASWSKHQETYKGPVHYPGKQLNEDDLKLVPEADRQHYEEVNQHYDRARIVRDFAGPIAKAKATGLPLHCGEFGVHKVAPAEDAGRWYRDVRSVFEEFDIAWTAWDWRGSFALFNDDGTLTPAGKAMLA
jgi:endoglucanase